MSNRYKCLQQTSHRACNTKLLHCRSVLSLLTATVPDQSRICTGVPSVVSREETYWLFWCIKTPDRSNLADNNSSNRSLNRVIVTLPSLRELLRCLYEYEVKLMDKELLFTMLIVDYMEYGLFLHCKYTLFQSATS